MALTLHVDAARWRTHLAATLAANPGLIPVVKGNGYGFGLDLLVAECARLLKPGGTLVIDALAAGRLSVLINVHLLERLPGGPPRGLHDPSLFVDRKLLLAAADRLGLDLELVGLRPSIREAIAWKFGRRTLVRMKPIRSTAVVFAGYGRKR